MMTADLGTWLLDFKTDVPTIELTLSGWPLDVLLRMASSTTTEWKEDRGVRMYLSICSYTYIVITSNLLIHSSGFSSSSALKSGAFTYHLFVAMQSSNWLASDAR
jgi:hypothetical protein